jgi:uncharacterized membrane protein
VTRDSLSDDDATVGRYAHSATAFRGLPGDLIVVVIYTVLVGGLIGIVGVPSTLQFVLGIPLLLFVPGYAVLAALFPGRPSRNAGQVSALSEMSRQFSSLRSIQQRGVRWGERVGLSFGLSLFIAPLLALVLEFTALVLGTSSLYRTGPIVALLVLFSLLFTVVGVVHRLQLPRSQRFAVPVGYWVEDFVDSLTGSPVDALLNLVLILSIIAAVASMTYALAVPQDATTTTGFRVGSLDESGQFVLNPPSNLTESEPQQFAVNILNHEQQTMNYTVIVQLERRSGSNIELDRFSTTIPSNQTWQTQRTVVPTIAGDDFRLKFLLYQGNAPQNATEANSYHSINISVNVSSNGRGG